MGAQWKEIIAHVDFSEIFHRHFSQQIWNPGNTQTTTTTTVQIQGQQSPTPLLSPDLNSETQVTPRQEQQAIRWFQIQILGQQPPRLLLGLHWQLSQESWLSSDDCLSLPPTMNNEELREAGFCKQFVKTIKGQKTHSSCKQCQRMANHCDHLVQNSGRYHFSGTQCTTNESKPILFPLMP